jgi:hypothetical protein
MSYNNHKDSSLQSRITGSQRIFIGSTNKIIEDRYKIIPSNIVYVNTHNDITNNKPISNRNINSNSGGQYHNIPTYSEPKNTVTSSRYQDYADNIYNPVMSEYANKYVDYDNKNYTKDNNNDINNNKYDNNNYTNDDKNDNKNNNKRIKKNIYK